MLRILLHSPHENHRRMNSTPSSLLPPCHTQGPYLKSILCNWPTGKQHQISATKPT